jgi:hypothetical protein
MKQKYLIVFVNILISVMDKTRVESKERSGWVLRKPYAPAFGSKNTHLLPQRGKKCSVSGFALLSRLERNRARSAFKRLFPPKSLRRVLALNTLGQSLRVFDALSLIYNICCYRVFGDVSIVFLFNELLISSGLT